MTVSEVFNYIDADLQRVEKALMDNLSSEASLIPVVGEYITRSGGKRFRPAVLILASRALGYRGKRMVTFACVTEYMHTASLLHDDVVDEAPVRRGNPSAHTVFGNKVSILVGDFLFARASELMVRDGDLEILKIFSRTLVHLTEGEVLQMTRSTSPRISEDDYLKIVFHKTASLICAASETAAVISGADGRVRKDLYAYGEAAGIAFQLVDDILDYLGYEGATGKKKGTDLREGKITLPVIHALSKMGRKARSETERLLRRVEDDSVVEELIARAIEMGGIDYTRKRAEDFVARAVEKLNSLPAGKPRDGLEALTRYIVERDR
ncbi:MAG: polyprenyl synthetase family protein [Deltaproteobacteria bacterium]|nr:MAG: polyprenyl synthetase family protein [Deltaproteobacteria bacterium]